MTILAIAQHHGTYRAVSAEEHAGPCPKCGGAMRLRIWSAQERFACKHCGLEGGIEQALALWPTQTTPPQMENDAPMRVIDGGEVWFPCTPAAWKRLAKEGKVAIGPKEAVILANGCTDELVEGVMKIKEVFPGSFLIGIKLEDVTA